MTDPDIVLLMPVFDLLDYSLLFICEPLEFAYHLLQLIYLLVYVIPVFDPQLLALLKPIRSHLFIGCESALNISELLHF